MKADVSAGEAGNEPMKPFYLEDEGRWFDLSSAPTTESVSGREPSDHDDEEMKGHHESWYSFQTT